MRRSLSLMLLALVVLAAPARAAEVPPGAKWQEATIASSDGVQLHADILRPAHLPQDAKTPVILSIGPYFNHAGQVGAAGPIQNAPYDPISPAGGPSDRFHDLVVGAKLMERGYTFVMVDLRGFGGSTGCLDWGGPGEQEDVVKAVEWAANKDGNGLPWSSGSVGMYGKSYDGVTGLVGVNKQPYGLKAVVSQEPVYDLYRYLYGDGMRRANSLLTPALYDVIAATPGAILDSPNYTLASLNDPLCLAANLGAQAFNDDHESAFWKARDLIPGAKGSQVPLFLTQGLTENNTVADGMAQYLENHTGYERAWLGPWEHVRGAETDADGRLLMGRKGWYDEVIRFYDRFLKGVQPQVTDPMVAVQTNDGKWRGEDAWPPADATPVTTTLRPGTYRDSGQSFATGSDASATSGVWTVSPPLKHDAHLAGSGKLVVDVQTTLPRANLAVDVYDLDASGKGPLITRQGHMIRQSGKLELDLWSADWKIPAGHRIGVRITETNLDWWLLTLGTQQTVTVKSASLTLPFLRYQRTDTIEGAPGTQLESYLADRVELPAEQLAAAESKDFVLPPAMVARPAAAAGPAAPVAGSAPSSAPAPAAVPKPVRTVARALKVLVKLRALAKRRYLATGTVPRGSKLVIKLKRGGLVVATKRLTAKTGTFRVLFKVRSLGGYRVTVDGTATGGRKLTGRSALTRTRR